MSRGFTNAYRLARVAGGKKSLPGGRADCKLNLGRYVMRSFQTPHVC
jgi:hypothetical protein